MSIDPYKPPPGAPGAGAAVPSLPQRVEPSGLPRGFNPYDESVDLNQVLTPDQQAAYSRHDLRPGLPPGGVVVLTLLTGGLFASIYLQLKQSRLPVAKHDDPRAGKAIGFMFIPIFNLYWYFVVWRRLVDRINLQYRLRARPSPIDRSHVTTAQVLGLVGWILIIPGIVGWIWLLVLAGRVQAASNDLAAGSV